jgi:phospholipase/carboxylesterase
MPRTQRFVPAFSAQHTPSSALQLETATCSSAALDFAHTLFAPMHYTASYAYPLIVWLHGRGSDERQLQRVMPLVSMRNFVAVAPRGLRVSLAGNPEKEGFGWEQTDDHIAQAAQRVFEAVEMTGRKLHIAPRRVFLVGFDCGGTMAFRLAMNHPERFAGVVSVDGAFPSGRTPFGKLLSARRLGVFLITGRASSEYPADEVCENLRLFHAAGLSVTLRQYPCGHKLTPHMLADINRWIIEQITPPPSPAAESSDDCLADDRFG